MKNNTGSTEDQDIEKTLSNLFPFIPVKISFSSKHP